VHISVVLTILWNRHSCKKFTTRFKSLTELFRPKGIFLLHIIARLKPEHIDPLLKKYIFPNGYIPALGEIVEAAQDVGLYFSDLEDPHLHYNLTLGCWIERFEANATKVRKMIGKQLCFFERDRIQDLGVCFY
jgi:cyclopropane-fatty-acyl-phospholipid synthase